MDDMLFIVIWRSKSEGIWKPESRGVFTELRLAENLIECQKASGSVMEYAIVSGPVCIPTQMEEVERALGAF